jgi:hypothetical protein
MQDLIMKCQKDSADLGNNAHLGSRLAVSVGVVLLTFA